MNHLEQVATVDGSKGAMRRDEIWRTPTKATVFTGYTRAPSATGPMHQEGRFFDTILATFLPLLLVLGTSLPASSAGAQSPPRVTTVSFANSPASGDTYELGEIIEVTVTFDRAVSYNGAQELALTIGTHTRLANTSSLPNTTSMSFRYVVEAEDRDADGISIPANAIRHNGSLIYDAADPTINADLSHNPVSDDRNRKVDGGIVTAPSVTSISFSPSPFSGDTYEQGESIYISVNFDRVVAATGAPRMALTVGTRTRLATHWYTGFTSSTFSYVVQAGDRDRDGVSIPVNAIRLSGGTITAADRTTDADLTHAAVPDDPTRKVDGVTATTPRVSAVEIWSHPYSYLSALEYTFEFGETIWIFVEFDRPVKVTGAPQLAVIIGTRTRYATLDHIPGSGLRFSYDVQATDRDTDGISIPGNAIRLNGGTIKAADGTTDASLANEPIPDNPNFKVNGAVASPSQVARIGFNYHPRNGDSYETGETIEISVRFTRAVTVTGTPRFSLVIGARRRHATHTDYASDGDLLIFRYKVRSADRDTDGISIPSNAIFLNGGSIKNAGDGTTDADLTHAAVPDDPTHKVDAVLKVTDVRFWSKPVEGDAYGLGEEIQIGIGLNLPVGVNGTPLETLIITGRPQVALTVGARTRLANYTGRSESGVQYMYFSYVVKASDLDTNGIGIPANAIRLNGGSITSADEQSTPAVLTPAVLTHDAVPEDLSHKVDGSIVYLPEVETVAFELPPLNGETFELGAVIWVYVEFDYGKPGVEVTGTPRLALNIGDRTRWATYHSGAPSDSRGLHFRYTVQASDLDADGIVIPANAIRLDGGSVKSVRDGTTDAVLTHDSVRNYYDWDNDSRVYLKVDGTAVSAPAIAVVGPLWNYPANGHTYVRGETIRVLVVFDKVIEVTGEGRMALTIGERTRQARYASAGSNDVWLSFDYVVQASDLDSNGLSLPADALTLNGGTVKAAFDGATDARLTHAAVPDDEEQKVNGAATTYVVPLFTAANQSQQGFARIINHSNRAGTVRISGIDDAGQEYGPVILSVDARATRHFNSRDLEGGNVSKGLDGGLGDGQGSWRLTLHSDLNIEPAAYIRTPDGFLTAIHDVVPTLKDSSGTRHQVSIFNPGSNRNQVSWLRLVNLADESVTVTIRGRDDAGRPAPGGEVRVTLPAGGARRLSAEQLESGAAGFDGRLGDGTGKWQLSVTADGSIQVMSLLQTPTGHLANLSTSLKDTRSGTARVPYVIPLFTAANQSQQGFARIINHSNRAGTVRISGIDDAGQEYGPVILSVDARATRHFNSRDLEGGNMSKGLDGGLGDGHGSWRLTLHSDLDIEPAAYIRTPDGFLTAMHDVVPTVEGSSGTHHQVSIFNPGSNRNQVSWLRLVNLAEDSANVTIRGRDDAGRPAPGGEVRVALPAGGARRLSAEQLESGAPGFSGRLGDGTGKWQLSVTTDGSIQVMSLLQTPTGHLANLSTIP